jgi:rubrerythrin
MGTTMATLVGTQKDTGTLINSLLELEYDAIAAYEVAIERLEAQNSKKALEGFLADHRRHVKDLTVLAHHYTQKVAGKADAKQILTTGKVKLGALIGDRAILMAMITNEQDTNTAYERAINHEGFEADMITLLKKNLADERRHREWLQKAVA